MKKRLVGVFGIISLLLVGGLVHHTTKSIYAANTDNSKESWSAIGTIGGSSWNKDFPLVYDATDDRYELEIALTAGNEFKIRKDKAWTTEIGYGGNTGAGISTYLQNSGGNFKVKTTGNYVLWVKDDNVRNYGDKSYGFGIDKAADVKYCTVTHYDENGSVDKEEKVIESSSYNPYFVEKEGYRLEGWYSDKNLTNKFEKGSKVTQDMNLYPKYVEDKDYIVYFDDKGEFGDAVYAYMWCDSFDGHFNETWPGKKLEKDEAGKYIVNVDASKSFDKIIFNNSTAQTTDTELNAANEDTYVLVKTGETYSATLEHTGITNVLARYYNEGTYTRQTTINIDQQKVKTDLETSFPGEEYSNLFHAESTVLERTTYFTPEALWMTRGKDSTSFSYYGTDSNGNMTTGSATKNGVAPENVGTVTKDQYYWDDTTEDGMEGYYVTLKDILEDAANVEWEYANGVYSSKGLKEQFLAFTAPCFFNTFSREGLEHYIKLTSVSVELSEEGLILKLHAAGDSGKLQGTNNTVLSQAVITYEV